MRLLLITGIVVCALIAPYSGAAGPSLSLQSDGADGGSAACRQRVNDTLAKLEQCIKQASLWRHLSRFQRIADQNPDKNGHGNRDTGTTGYAASVKYVAGLMKRAGYNVTIQPYQYKKSDVVGEPEFRSARRAYALDREWFVARRSAGGSVTAAVAPPNGDVTGCAATGFARFTRGNIALIERGSCALDVQVAHAEKAGAAAVILYNTPDGDVHEARLVEAATVPVIGLASSAVGAELLAQYRSGNAPTVHVGIRMQTHTGVDYNVIADSPYGDPNHVVVIDAHLDSIYGAGMLDNASGSTSILEVALAMAQTPTQNQLRYIWFGGEEIGLLGSRYYTRNLTQQQLQQIAFDVDVDVTATPNFDLLVADPRFAHNADRFPPNVVPQSKKGNQYFYDFFQQAGAASQAAWFGNDGTDSNAFSLVGVPNTGILTQQDCCKHKWETKIWGGYLGNYEGEVPGHDGGCVDNPHRWCDNLSNNDPFLLELVSKSVAFATFKLANRRTF
jgi:Peptidase family M28/PA domain